LTPPPGLLDLSQESDSSIFLAEAFAICGDLIEQVEAVGTSVPYHSDPGWER
jgi:hypothetical protein